MARKSKQMSASIAAGQTMELREEPRQFITSTKSSVFSPKSAGLASDDDEPPAYINDLPLRTRDQFPQARSPLEGNWQSLNMAASVYSPTHSLGQGYSSHGHTGAAEIPLRPNRREDSEFWRENFSLPSQVLLPASANSGPKRQKSSDGTSIKNWLMNVKSPIGEPRVFLLPYDLCCPDRRLV